MLGTRVCNIELEIQRQTLRVSALGHAGKRQSWQVSARYRRILHLGYERVCVHFV
jgi:hypothetical protein